MPWWEDFVRGASNLLLAISWLLTLIIITSTFAQVVMIHFGYMRLPDASPWAQALYRQFFDGDGW